ncbi:CapA family protein [Gemella haemolysans]|uniref:CapA family protein n=1 Tax=Gemella haemolysans TaxID=1379 RepID=A0AAW6B2G5_9BACL|nr:CapA family protein [Gemella haemolysans]MDB6185969.1 CapA family protein [Gemella haemolysans]MDU4714571.1 CapA family protein [Gemella haemolysans]
MRKVLVYLLGVLSISGIIFSCIYFLTASDKEGGTSKKDSDSSVRTARVVANGDILIHDALYYTAKKEDGSYDFNPFFEYVKPWIEGADLAIGDFEGTISDRSPLGGYPLFNAPVQIADTMKEVGYDVVDLAHNHILDTGLYGLKYTDKVFKDRGLDTVGVHADKKRSEDKILIKEVNGIKIAILAYAYGYNGMDANLTAEDRTNHLSDLDEEKMKEEIQRAEKEADVTVVMPQMGVEYKLEPTEEQKALYHKMIEWGADVVFGGHPHVIEPAETVEKDGDKKFIIYSMGNFVSNQRMERMENKWPERGLLMDVTFEKANDKTTVKTVKAHPTLVYSKLNGRNINGAPLYDYKIMVLEDFINGGKLRDQLDDKMKEKVDVSYKEIMEHVNLKWE